MLGDSFVPNLNDELVLVPCSGNSRKYCLLITQPTDSDIAAFGWEGLEVVGSKARDVFDRVSKRGEPLLVGTLGEVLICLSPEDLKSILQAYSREISDGADYFILFNNPNLLSNIRTDKYIDLQKQDIQIAVSLAKSFNLEIYCETVMSDSVKNGFQYPIIGVFGSEIDELSFAIAWELFKSRHVQIEIDHSSKKEDDIMLSVAYSRSHWGRHLLTNGGRIGTLFPE